MKTKRKRESLEKMGYTVTVMKECDWDKLIKQDHVLKTPTRMANILKSDDEASLLAAIKNAANLQNKAWNLPKVRTRNNNLFMP